MHVVICTMMLLNSSNAAIGTNNIVVGTLICYRDYWIFLFANFFISSIVEQIVCVNSIGLSVVFITKVTFGNVALKDVA